MVEPLVFGRSASGEVIQRVSLRDRVSISRSGVPLYRDGIAVQGDLSRIPTEQRPQMGQELRRVLSWPTRTPSNT